MKKLSLIGFCIVMACATTKESVDNDDALHYSESSLDFYDPHNKDFTFNTWIRKPENIRVAHETFKKYGYNKLVSDYELASNPCMIWGYVNKPCDQIIDSLLLTFPHSESSPAYYKQFWGRRRSEKNDSTVFEILKEIKEELINKRNVVYNERLVNDTIFNLLRITFEQPDNVQEALGNFDYLTKLGLNLSAYNLLFEYTLYEGINWDREKLKESLKKDTTACCFDPIIPDNQK